VTARNARRIHRIDANQGAIIEALHRVGCTTQSLTSIGGGCPDLLVARANKLYLLEIKTDGGTLEQSQLDWIKGWNSQVHTVRSIEGALAVVGLIKATLSA